MKPPFYYKEFIRDGWTIEGIFDADNKQLIGTDEGWDSPGILPETKTQYQLIVNALNLYFEKGVPDEEADRLQDRVVHGPSDAQ